MNNPNHQPASEARPICNCGANWEPHLGTPAPHANDCSIWHNPDNLPSPGEPPWRFLVVGETVKEGDQFWGKRSKEWIHFPDADKPATTHTYRTRRPLPLARTEAGEGKDVFAGFRECAENQVPPPPETAAAIDAILKEGDASDNDNSNARPVVAEASGSNPLTHSAGPTLETVIQHILDMPDDVFAQAMEESGASVYSQDANSARDVAREVYQRMAARIDGIDEPMTEDQIDAILSRHLPNVERLRGEVEEKKALLEVTTKSMWDFKAAMDKAANDRDALRAQLAQVRAERDEAKRESQKFEDNWNLTFGMLQQSRETVTALSADRDALRKEVEEARELTNIAKADALRFLRDKHTLQTQLTALRAAQQDLHALRNFEVGQLNIAIEAAQENAPEGEAPDVGEKPGEFVAFVLRHWYRTAHRAQQDAREDGELLDWLDARGTYLTRPHWEVYGKDISCQSLRAAIRAARGG